MHHLKSFHKKYPTSVYRHGGGQQFTGYLEDKISFSLPISLGSGVKMWIYCHIEKLVKASIDVQVWNSSQII